MKNNKKKIINIYISFIVSITLYIILSIFVDKYVKDMILLNIIMIILTVIFLTYILIFIKKDLKFCSYKCKNCNHIFKPEYNKVVFSPHIGMKKLLKCPKCNKMNWNKKVLDK